MHSACEIYLGVLLFETYFIGELSVTHLSDRQDILNSSKSTIILQKRTNLLVLVLCARIYHISFSI